MRSFRGILGRFRARLTGRKYGARRGTAAEVGTSVRRSRQGTLSIGGTLIAVLIGAGAALGADALLQKYVTKNRGVRLAIHAGLAVAFWFIGGAVALRYSAALAQGVKLAAGMAMVSGVIIIGVDTINAAAGKP